MKCVLRNWRITDAEALASGLNNRKMPTDTEQCTDGMRYTPMRYDGRNQTVCSTT